MACKWTAIYEAPMKLYMTIYISPPPSREIVFLMSISTRYWNATSSAHTAHHRWTACTTRPSHYTLAKKGGGETSENLYVPTQYMHTHTSTSLPGRQKRWGNVWDSPEDVERGQNISKSSLYVYMYIYSFIFYQ